VSNTSKNSSSSTDTTGGKKSDDSDPKRQKTSSTFGGGFLASTGSLSLALKSSRNSVKSQKRTSFLGHSQSSSFIGSQDLGISQKSISFNHVVFQSCGGDSQLSSSRFGGVSQASNSQKSFGLPPSGRNKGRRPSVTSRGSSSLWSKVMTTGPQKRC